MGVWPPAYSLFQSSPVVVSHPSVWSGENWLGIALKKSAKASFQQCLRFTLDGCHQCSRAWEVFNCPAAGDRVWTPFSVSFSHTRMEYFFFSQNIWFFSDRCVFWHSLRARHLPIIFFQLLCDPGGVSWLDDYSFLLVVPLCFGGLCSWHQLLIGVLELFRHIFCTELEKMKVSESFFCSNPECQNLKVSESLLTGRC